MYENVTKDFKQASSKRNPMGFSSWLLRDKLELFELYKASEGIHLTRGALNSIWDHLSHAATGISTYRVFREGAKKHPAEESWHQSENAIKVYEQALFRHYLWEIYYPESDGVDESGEPHSSHALANCAILWDLYNTEQKEYDAVVAYEEGK